MPLLGLFSFGRRGRQASFTSGLGPSATCRDVRDLVADVDSLNWRALGAGQCLQLDFRSDLKPARTSSEKSFGCSQAAKCPPFSTLL